MTRPYNRTAPIMRSGVVQSDEMDIGQSAERVMPSEGSNLDSFQPKMVVTPDESHMDKEKIAMLAFMAEPVMIRIATSSDPNAEQCFELNINGQLRFFQRGETYTVPRYFLDRLMRLKQTTYRQKEVFNKEGVKQYAYPATTALKYDYAIIRDDNPLGRSWERAVLAEPA